MKIGVLRESEPERRVAIIPEGIKALKSLQCDLLVEYSAGAAAFFSDRQYQEAGGELLSRKDILTRSDMILMIHAPAEEELGMVSPAAVLVGCFNPYFNGSLVKLLQQKNLTTYSLELVPRTTRAQSMDILSSMATVAGYKAVLQAASALPTFFPMFMSAAGTIKPAKLLVLGAGVAGLQALSIARKLGAVVEVFDVRSAVKEEVLSLGGKFIEVEGAREDAGAGGYAVEQGDEFKRKQGELIHQHALKSDVIIATAQIPGRKAPVLVRKETVDAMKPGSVIIDLAASTGGNCEYTCNNETVTVNGVSIIGKSDFPADMPTDASRMYNNNLVNFLKLLIGKQGSLNLDFSDEILKGTCLTHQGTILHDKVRDCLG
jgi:NAD(P) transhydrogenase subunit alpha